MIFPVIFLNKLKNIPHTYPCIPAITDGVVDGRLEFAGWVADQWTLPEYPGIFGVLKEIVKRGMG